MAAASEKYFHATATELGLNTVPRDALERFYKAMFWKVFDEYRYKEILKVNKWFFKFTLTIDSLRPRFEEMFGPHPTE